MPPPSRYRAIDVLRGWAIVIMVATHVGGVSHVTTLINLPLWLDPAGPFVLLSGLVLGMAARAGKGVESIWKRARQLWLIHVCAMVVVLVVHEATGRLRSPNVADAGGVIAAAWKLPALRLQATEYMNILPLFVVFFLVAPLLVTAMRKDRTWSCLAVSCGLWLFTQHDPTWLRFTDVSCGPEAFVLPAWQFPFVVGLTFGFHVKDAGARVFPRLRGWLVPLAAGAIGTLFILAQLQRNAATRLGAHLPPSLVWLFAKETWAPGRAVYTLGLLGLGYLVVDQLVKRNVTWGLAPLEVLGKRSLYCFLVHLPFALLFSFFALGSAKTVVQDACCVGALVTVYFLAKHHVLGKYIPS